MPTGIFFDGIGAVRYLLSAIINYASSFTREISYFKFSYINSAVPCHRSRSIIHSLLPGIKEEMKECQNIKEIKNRFSKKLDIQNKLDFHIYK